jgi:hypothetical protein
MATGSSSSSNGGGGSSGGVDASQSEVSICFVNVESLTPQNGISDRPSNLSPLSPRSFLM